MINFECPNCHAYLSVEENQAGASVQCPKCNNVATVPGVLNIGNEFKERCSEAAMPAPSEKSRKWCAFCHLGGMIMVVPLNIIIAMIFWLSRKDEFQDVDTHGKAAINFQLTCTVIYLILFIFARYIGMMPLKIAILLNFIFSIMAAVKAGQGKTAKYPFLFKFISL